MDTTCALWEAHCGSHPPQQPLSRGFFSGTCTLLDQELKPGSIVVASPGSLGCYTNYAYFDGTAVEYSRTEGALIRPNL